MTAVAAIPSHEPARPEGGAWDGVRAGWRLLYGGFSTLGVSIEHHAFTAHREIDWGRSFHPGSIELCLNLEGSGRLRSGSVEQLVAPGTAVAYSHADQPLLATRAAGEKHRFLTVELRHDFIARQVAGAENALDPLVREGALRSKPRTRIGTVRSLTVAHERLAASLSAPPVGPTALPLWYQSKVLELIAEFLFAPATEMFCERQKKLAHDRVDRVKHLIETNIAEPPTLDEISRQVGVSQFYLSRTFSSEVGMTIPQYLRRLRMERAAGLLSAGSHNVTEAAFAVGYASLGHFSKSFCEVIGCCPTLYPHARNLSAVPRGASRR
jgi:AraC-like DNA-binding protein